MNRAVRWISMSICLSVCTSSEAFVHRGIRKYDAMWCHGMMSWRHLTSLGKNTDKESTAWEARLRSGVFSLTALKLAMPTRKV